MYDMYVWNRSDKKLHPPLAPHLRGRNPLPYVGVLAQALLELTRDSLQDGALDTRKRGKENG